MIFKGRMCGTLLPQPPEEHFHPKHGPREPMRTAASTIYGHRGHLLAQSPPSTSMERTWSRRAVVGFLSVRGSCRFCPLSLLPVPKWKQSLLAFLLESVPSTVPDETEGTVAALTNTWFYYSATVPEQRIYLKPHSTMSREGHPPGHFGVNTEQITHCCREDATWSIYNKQFWILGR